jgi:hypothetical protein
MGLNAQEVGWFGGGWISQGVVGLCLAITARRSGGPTFWRWGIFCAAVCEVSRFKEGDTVARK